MKTVEEIIEELFWADEDGVVRFVSNSAGLENLRRAVEQVVTIREEEMRKEFREQLEEKPENAKEIQDWYNIREGRWEDLTVEQQIEYAFKLGFSWGVGTDVFDQKAIDKIFENDKM